MVRGTEMLYPTLSVCATLPSCGIAVVCWRAILVSSRPLHMATAGPIHAAYLPVWWFVLISKRHSDRLLCFRVNQHHIAVVKGSLVHHVADTAAEQLSTLLCSDLVGVAYCSYPGGQYKQTSTLETTVLVGCSLVVACLREL